jgi:hypothetical protein
VARGAAARGVDHVAMVAGARARGLDITTEAYPYIAGMTAINSALIQPGLAREAGCAQISTAPRAMFRSRRRPTSMLRRVALQSEVKEEVRAKPEQGDIRGIGHPTCAAGKNS